MNSEKNFTKQHVGGDDKINGKSTLWGLNGQSVQKAGKQLGSQQDIGGVIVTEVVDMYLAFAREIVRKLTSSFAN